MIVPACGEERQEGEHAAAGRESKGQATHHGRGRSERARGDGEPQVADRAAVDHADARRRADSEHAGDLEHEERRSDALRIENESARDADVGGGPAVDAGSQGQAAQLSVGQVLRAGQRHQSGVRGSGVVEGRGGSGVVDVGRARDRRSAGQRDASERGISENDSRARVGDGAGSDDLRTRKENDETRRNEQRSSRKNQRRSKRVPHSSEPSRG
jgi:hypothetical protein